MLSDYKGNPNATPPQQSGKPYLVTFAGSGGILAPINGGTGLDGSSAANGALLIGNGFGYSLNPLTQGPNILITQPSAGNVQIALGTLINPNYLVSPLTGSPAFTWNMLTEGVVATIALTAASTLANPTNQVAGDIALIISQDGVGGRTLTFGVNYKFPSGVPIINQAANSVTVLEFISDGINLFLISESTNAAKTAKAWVNFNGTGVPAIRSQFNVASVVRVGGFPTGIYTVTFTQAMVDVNFACSLTQFASGLAVDNDIFENPVNRTVNSIQPHTSQGGVLADSTSVNVIIFGN